MACFDTICQSEAGWDGRLVGWLAGWLFGWLAGWLIRLEPLSHVGLVRWLVGWLVGWLVDWLVGWLVGWLVDWLVGWLVGWFGHFGPLFPSVHSNLDSGNHHS